MNEQNQIAEARSLSAITFIIGIWLVIAPYVLNYNNSIAYWSEVITGAAIAAFSLGRLLMPRLSLPSWLNGLAGIWMIVSPFALGYTSAVAYWNEIIFGIIVAVLAYSNVGSVRRERHTHHPAH